MNATMNATVAPRVANESRLRSDVGPFQACFTFPADNSAITLIVRTRADCGSLLCNLPQTVVLRVLRVHHGIPIFTMAAQKLRDRCD